LNNFYVNIDILKINPLTKKKEGIPEDKIINCEFHSLRIIAKRQILSLIKRMIVTQNYSLYRREINRVILYGKSEIN